MPAQIRVAQMRQKIDFPNPMVINPCSNSVVDWQSDLSPFIVGPCDLYARMKSVNFENAWQFAKVYKRHVKPNGDIDFGAYFAWAKEGWYNPKAIRYPMGRGAKPEFSYWDGNRYGYIEARKKIYGPLYIKAIIDRPGFQRLREIYETWDGTLVLRDFDGYDHVAKGMSLTQVVNNPLRKMGHAFVIAMLLLGDSALEEFK